MTKEIHSYKLPCQKNKSCKFTKAKFTTIFLQFSKKYLFGTILNQLHVNLLFNLAEVIF